MSTMILRGFCEVSQGNMGNEGDDGVWSDNGLAYA